MKGGVGKTTLCVNLAMEMFLQKKRVLLIDNDPQFNATSGLLKPLFYINDVLKKKDIHTIYHIYEREPRILGKKAPQLNPKSFFRQTWHFTGSPISLDLKRYLKSVTTT